MVFFVRMALGCCVLALLVSAAWPAAAQMTTGMTFDRTLETLRQSVASLLKENEAIGSRNASMRAKIRGLQADLSSLQAEAGRLEAKKEAQLHKAQGRTGGVDALKEQVARVDGILKQTRDEVAAQRDRYKALEDEEILLKQKADALHADMASMRAPGASSEAVGMDIAALREEQSSLKRQLSGVTDRVEAAKRRWQDAHDTVTAGPQQIEAFRAERDKLVKALPEAESELLRMDARLADIKADLEKLRSEDYSDTRAGRLESELKDMVERDRNLEVEIQSIIKTREERSRRSQEDREKARREYEARKAELDKRNRELRDELDSLRKQMVDLDKKKIDLEAVIYPVR